MDVTRAVSWLWKVLWLAPKTKSGAYFHAAFMCAITVWIITIQLRLDALDVDAYLFRLAWVAGTTGWALRLLYLADKEAGNSKQSRRGGLVVANLTVGALLP